MGNAKDVIAILAGIAGLWATAKMMDWWKGLQGFQVLLILACVYLVWWTLDRYHRSSLKAIRDAKTEANESINRVAKAMTELTGRYDNHVKEQHLQRNKDQNEFYDQIGKLGGRLNEAGIK